LLQKLTRKGVSRRKGPGRPRGSRDKRPRKPRSDKGKSRGGQHYKPRFRAREGPPKPSLRVRCPMCGMLVYRKRFVGNPDLTIFNQVARGGVEGWEYVEVESEGPLAEQIFKLVFLKILKILKFVDPDFKYLIRYLRKHGYIGPSNHPSLQYNKVSSIPINHVTPIPFTRVREIKIRKVYEDD